MFAGESQETVAEETPETAITDNGAEGAEFIDALGEAVDVVEVPALLVAVTLNV